MHEYSFIITSTALGSVMNIEQFVMTHVLFDKYSKVIMSKKRFFFQQTELGGILRITKHCVIVSRTYFDEYIAELACESAT